MTNLVTQVRAALADRDAIELALLFGSRARGDARPDSDLDVAVLGRSLDRLDLADRIARATGLEPQVVDLASAGIPLLRRLVREGIVVREARPGTYASWRTRAWLAIETDGPAVDAMRDAFLARLAGGR